jgi:hypothetical protein
MKTYLLTHMEEGCEAYVQLDDGKTYPLPLYAQIRNHSPSGFEFGYNGSGPAQLALAILADLFGPAHSPATCEFCGSPMIAWQCQEPGCAYKATQAEIYATAYHLYQHFKRDIICRLVGPVHKITSSDIQHWLSHSAASHS